MKGRILVALLLISWCTNGQISPVKFRVFCDSLIRYGVDQSLIPGAALSIVTPDSILLASGYGYSDYQRKIEANAQTLFQLGSVGKLLTAIGVLQQIESGALGLHEPVNTYLDRFQVDDRWGAITTFHLLTHTAGLNDRVIGYLARSNDDHQPLGEHLKENMPAAFQPPGQSINYSNYGYALAGYLSQIASGLPFDRYIKQNIFHPLQLRSSTYHLPDDYQDRESFAKGYQLRESFREVRSFPRHATPAGSFISNSADMARLLQAMLKRDSALLSDSSFQLLFEQQFTNHPVLPGYSLGLEIQRFNGYEAIGKGGHVPGFLSLVLFFPAHKLAMFLSVNTETDNFLEIFTRALKTEFFPRDTIPLQPEVVLDLKAYTGHYANERTNHESIAELFQLYMGHVELLKDGDHLKVFQNGRWHFYRPVSEWVFQNTKQPDRYLTFAKVGGRVTAMYQSVEIGGIQVPSSYRKLSWFERPRFMNDEYPVLLMVLLIYLLLPLAWLAVHLIRKRRPGFLMAMRVPFFYHTSALLFLGLWLWNVLGFFVPLLRRREELLFGVAPGLTSMKYLNWALALLAVVLLAQSVLMWIRRDGNWFFRIFFTFFSLIAFSYILILHRWHFLSVVV